MAALQFDPHRWEKVRRDAELWWAGKLKRPLILANVEGCPTDTQPPIPQYRHGLTPYDLSITPAKFIEQMDYNLSRTRWLGDAFPVAWPDFGPGVLAAFIGGQPMPADGTVWFHASHPTPIAELQFRFDGGNPWARRIADVYRAGIERWQGDVLMAMTDLGGNLDIVSTFRPSEMLPLDLLDSPADVKRLLWQAHDCWWQCFEHFNSLLQPINPGYSAWTPLYSRMPYYILQCDFAYMISPDMFQEFVLPELEASSRRLGNTFYHLDGVGQLAHLDSLLKIESLKGIQWIPGAGKPGPEHWPEVHRKIRAAGKLSQFFGPPGALDKLVEQLGSAEGIAMCTSVQPTEQDDLQEWLRRYDAV